MFFLPFIGSLLAGIGTTAVASALAPDAPKPPDYGAASKAGVQANLDTLPFRRQVEAAARQGLKGSAQLGSKTVDYDFTGRGDIDNEILNARNAAQTALDVSSRYGQDYIKEALAQEALADPEGVKARELLSQRILSDSDRTPDTALSDEVRRQIMAQLAARQGLDTQQNDVVQRAILARQAKGDQINPDITAAYTRGSSGLNRLASRQGAAQGYLTSGSTPTDIRYRSSQQNMANLGALINGQSPVTQFGQLSGAQQGAVPIRQGAPLPTVNPNAGAQGANYALGNYGTQMRAYGQQANPWMAGLSLAIKGAGAYGASRG